jgi:hypothetical protein
MLIRRSRQVRRVSVQESESVGGVIDVIDPVPVRGDRKTKQRTCAWWLSAAVEGALADELAFCGDLKDVAVATVDREQVSVRREREP